MVDLLSRNQKKSLPPNQRIIKEILKWGIDHPAIVQKIPQINRSDWRLIVSGEIEVPCEFNWMNFIQLPHITSTSDFHCVEGWSVVNCQWEGVQFKRLAEIVKPTETAKYVVFTCADGYTTSLRCEDAVDDEVILAYRLNGKDLEASLGGPLRVIVPEKYAYKSAMWVTQIRFVKYPVLGFWEKRGYSDTADVWKNDRYSSP